MAHAFTDNDGVDVTGSGPAPVRKIDPNLDPQYYREGERIFNPDKPEATTITVDFNVNVRQGGCISMARMFGAFLVSQGFTSVTVDDAEPWDEEAIRTYAYAGSSKEVIDAQKHVKVEIKTHMPKSV